MISLRSLMVSAACAVLFASAGWIGCATAGDEVDAVPGKKPKDGGGVIDDDETSPGTDTGKGGGGDGGGSCTGVTANTCTTAIEVASVALGGTKSESDKLPATGDRWFKVSFADLEDRTAHPRIKLTSSDSGIFFQVVKSCAGEGISCGEEGGLATKVTEFEMSYVEDPAKMGEPEGPAPDGVEAGVFKPMTVGEGGTVYVRVFRSGGSGGCDFKLDVSN